MTLTIPWPCKARTPTPTPTPTPTHRHSRSSSPTTISSLAFKHKHNNNLKLNNNSISFPIGVGGVFSPARIPMAADDREYDDGKPRNNLPEKTDHLRRRSRFLSEKATVGVIIGMHLLCLWAPFTFTWGAFWVAVGLYFITGLLGITLSYHRNLSHRSFKIPKWLEYSFAYCGAQALQGSPIDWVSTHRYHHQFSDSDKDPHSPREGFWFSHVGWLFDTRYIIQRNEKPSNVGDLEQQGFYRFIKSTYGVHPLLLGGLLYAMGGASYIVWGMGVRIVWVYHITWLVNSACHVWGRRVWNTGDSSRNNWWVAVVAFGEGWHNNHHAFQYSARHGLEWWQFDMTWYAVRLLQAAGFATHVKLPAAAHKKRLNMIDIN
ncbi:palmitoyl-monogalactosyldiacylglycerol delta-7 desaturase, chloroplastic-like [Andrographis paniculata]|uniref:palmitoyl-monogalactosyldiacylglycerol delta-7 desaturase, chloroplastic-like n=1 Tax=Andrographis paniculata TaxID=175694 RepID=UPI0021E9052C|nr:palmitoyl-monogalactosyldiacylglycerol delta-7 desaturase, chloroplastic-like [Andrographis paniculata]